MGRKSQSKRGSPLKHYLLRNKLAKQAVSEIIALHKMQMHEKAFEEANTYLADIYDDRKDELCKSYTVIASEIRKIPNSIHWQIKYCDLSIKTNKYDAVALNAKAELLANIGDTNKAIELLEVSLKIDPHNIISLNTKAKLLAYVGQVEKAMELLGYALEIEPYDVVTLNTKAKLFSQLGQTKKAMELLEIALEIEPHNEVTLNAKAKLF